MPNAVNQPPPDVGVDSSPPDPSLYFADPPQQATVLGPDAVAAGYLLWRCWAETLGKTGWQDMPVASDDSQGPLPSALVRLHAAFSRVRVHYRAVRVGSAPALPHPVLQDANFRLKHWRDRVRVTPSPNATQWVYAVIGRRVYACVEPVFGWLDGLLVPCPVFSTASKGSLDVPANAFVQSVL